MIIAIDGPSGAGKSTLGKMLAKKLGLLYLDTGAMYRAVALAALRQGIEPLTTDRRIADIAENAKIELVGEPDALKVMLDGEDVSTEIRTLEVAQAASVVSTISEVRRIMVEHQRADRRSRSERLRSRGPRHRQRRFSECRHQVLSDRQTRGPRPPPVLRKTQRKGAHPPTNKRSPRSMSATNATSHAKIRRSRSPTTPSSSTPANST